MRSEQQRLVRVAVPVPLAESFDYLWTAGGARPPLGCRVTVPFGRRERVGIVIDHPSASDLPADKLKRVHAALDAQPLVSQELLQTLLWAADYYHHPVGEVLSHALPGLLRKGRSSEPPGERVWRLTALGRQPPAGELRRAKQQARVLQLLGEAGALSDSELKRLRISMDTLRRLAGKAWIESLQRVTTPAGPAPHPRQGTLPELTEQQRNVLDAIMAQPAGYESYLLHGVTGSGKTEVYLRLIAAQLAAQRQTLLLVPEIGLTPQLENRLRERFAGELAVLHSALSQRQRFDAWRKAYSGAVKLVVGTRSAVFAPLPRAGLIIVDEEHDPSYKQQDGFRYSARDLAVLRGQRLKIPVLLASATPSLESFHNALQGRYRLLAMPQRIGSAGQPNMHVIDLGRHASRQALSTPLVARIERHLADGNQILLFINRRGFAPALFCPQCKNAENCARCDARMTVHASAGRLRCHHCGKERSLRWACEACGAERIAVGAATQRVTGELQALFPDARIARLDRDSTTRKGALSAVLSEVASGNTQILVGTQMLTKGHDFPRVTLVGVLNADQGLFGTDFRSHERLAQTMLQVAGRAGRRDLPGDVVIQTHYPAHPLLSCLVTHDYGAFARLALAERADAVWPPFSYLAAWRAEAPQRTAAFAFLDRVRSAAAPAAGEVRILGPAACVMERKDGRYRAQLLFRCTQRAPLHELLSRALLDVRRSPEARKVRWSVDVDPIEL